MSWHIQGIAHTSALSESTFAEGEQVLCLIYRDFESGEIRRADILPTEEAHFQLSGDLLGRWFRRVKESGDPQPTVRDKVSSAEEFFLSLYESSKDADSSEDTDALKYLLALMLERKRVVSTVGKRAARGVQSYLHIQTKQTLDVPIVDISPDLMLRIQETLGDILL